MLRSPAGGKRPAATIRSASRAVATWGTRMPSAPASRTAAIADGEDSPTRTTAKSPAPRAAAMSGGSSARP